MLSCRFIATVDFKAFASHVVAVLLSNDWTWIGAYLPLLDDIFCFFSSFAETFERQWSYRFSSDQVSSTHRITILPPEDVCKAYSWSDRQRPAEQIPHTDCRSIQVCVSQWEDQLGKPRQRVSMAEHHCKLKRTFILIVHNLIWFFALATCCEAWSADQTSRQARSGESEHEFGRCQGVYQ